MSARDYLGLDCGGTRSRWAWHPERAVAAATAGPAVQPAVQGVAAAARSLGEVLRAATASARATAAVAAVAGAGDPAVAGALGAAVREDGIAFPLAVVGDVVAAAAGALGDGPGLLLWSGTGSFAVARAADGALHRAGGRGFLLGDQGSAFDLVRRAAAAAVLAVDGLGPATALGERLAHAFAAPSAARLGAVLQRLPAGEVAAQLPVVLDCAARGDEVAQAVLGEGADALALVGNAVVRLARLEWGGLPIALGGGVFASATAVREIVQERVSAFGGGEARLCDDEAAARGAARLAAAWHQGRQPLCRWVTDAAL